MIAKVLTSSLVPRRRSSRLQSSQRSISIPHILGSYYESQSPLEQQPTDPQTSQPVGATSNTRVPTLGPVEVSAPVPSRAQFQGWLWLLFSTSSVLIHIGHARISFSTTNPQDCTTTAKASPFKASTCIIPRRPCQPAPFESYSEKTPS
jgi:hypothetical protein